MSGFQLPELMSNKKVGTTTGNPLKLIQSLKFNFPENPFLGTVPPIAQQNDSQIKADRTYLSATVVLLLCLHSLDEIFRKYFFCNKIH